MEEAMKEALDYFYKHNNIDYMRYTDNKEVSYEKGLEFDDRIYKDSLENRLNVWLQSFEDIDKEYYLKMFENYDYYTEKKFSYEVYRLGKFIYDEYSSCPKEKILLVFAENKNGYKSGSSQMSAEWWKSNKGEIGKSHLIECYSKVEEEELLDYNVIVFLDDIVATGETLKATIRSFFKRFPLVKFKGTKFVATGLLATKRGKRAVLGLNREGILIEWLYPDQKYLKQAFLGEHIFKGEQVKEIESRILRYEESVGRGEDGKDYVMGYAGSKLLVSFFYETPNNTLCTFWRYGEKHVPLFERSSNQKFSLAEIKRRKEQLRKNAYNIKSMEEKL